jgi:hypothetical protein
MPYAPSFATERTAEAIPQRRDNTPERDEEGVSGEGLREAADVSSADLAEASLPVP